MTRHFTPEEFVDVLEGTIDAARAAHLEACDACRREATTMGSVLTAVRQADEPAAPSPMFWPHFATRVRGAVRAEVSAGGWAAWRRVDWRFAAAAAAVLVMAVTAAWVSRTTSLVLPETTAAAGDAFDPPGPLPAPREPIVVADAGAPAGVSARPTDVPAAAAEDAGWQRVVGLAGPAPTAEALAVAPGPTTGSAMLIDELSPAQLREFMRLLRAEMGGLQ